MKQKVTTAKRGPNVWVVCHRGRFSVKEERSAGRPIPAVPQRIAITIARLIDRANRGELIIQGEGGRIRARDSHGADPYPPKG